jgi:hypothetical protein
MATTPPLAQPDNTSWLDSVQNSLTEFGADTIGVVWRGVSGTTDPFTDAELEQQATQGQIDAGGTTAQVDAAAAQSDADTTNANANAPSYSQAASDALASVTSDNGTGCGITNLGGCVPTWFWWVAGAAGVLLILYLIRPEVELANG